MLVGGLEKAFEAAFTHIGGCAKKAYARLPVLDSIEKSIFKTKSFDKFIIEHRLRILFCPRFALSSV